MTERVDYDSPWKTIIEQHLEDCLSFYFPTLHAAIDWVIPPIFREQELQQIAVDSDIGTRRVDKLVDVQLTSGESESELLASANPFALVTLAQLAENVTAKIDGEKYATKLRLMRLLFGKGYDKAAIRNLFTFIDWILQLPLELELQLQQKLVDSSKDKNMQYVSFLERHAQAKGREEGREEGLELAIQTVLNSRFGDAPTSIMEPARQLDENGLQELLTFVLVARSLEDIQTYLLK